MTSRCRFAGTARVEDVAFSHLAAPAGVIAGPVDQDTDLNANVPQPCCHGHGKIEHQ